MHLLALLLAFIPTASAYPPEVPLFQQTEFREEYGMFRWYQGCWFRIRHNYAYIICSPDGGTVDRVPLSSIPELIESGLLPADSMTGRLVDRLFGRTNIRTPANSRLSAGRTTAAPGDGTRLSDLFGGGTSGFSRFSDFTGMRGLGSFDTGVFYYDGIGSVSGSRFSGNTNSRGGDGSAGGNGKGPLGRPLGFGCTNIHDSKDGGMLGPIPCTSYPGVLGPVPRY